MGLGSEKLEKSGFHSKNSLRDLLRMNLAEAKKIIGNELSSFLSEMSAVQDNDARKHVSIR